MPNKYGLTAIEAATDKKSGNPIDAWEKSTRRIFPKSLASQRKGCPRAAFLGLCEEGVVKGISPGRYTKSRDNKEYALRAWRILRAEKGPTEVQSLWLRVIKGMSKTHNGQMDVVLALYSADLLS